MNAIDGNEFGTQGVISRRQTHRQADAVQTEKWQGGNDIGTTDRAERNALKGQAQTVGIGEHPHRLGHRFDIVEWFTHAHEHHIARHQPGVSRCRHHLADDLVGGKIADESHGRGSAEPAAHAAADLGTDADRMVRTALHRDVHRLDLAAIGEAQQQLGGGPLLGVFGRRGINHHGKLIIIDCCGDGGDGPGP